MDNTSLDVDAVSESWLEELSVGTLDGTDVGLLVQVNVRDSLDVSFSSLSDEKLQNCSYSEHGSAFASRQFVTT